MTVRIEQAGEHVAELVLDRPGARNAISTAQARAITGACTDLATRSGVRAVLITSAVPGAFCAGADLKERAGLTDEELRANRSAIRDCFAAVRSLPMPVIAVVEGYALGGGCELALSADLVVAGAAATFGLPEVGVGLVPGGGGTQLLSRRLGYNRAADLVLTGRRVDADEAARIGLADRLSGTGQARTVAIELAGLVASRSPTAVRHAKHALRVGADLPLTDGLAVEDAAWAAVAFTADRVEGIAAFVEKRPPVWSDG